MTLLLHEDNLKASFDALGCRETTQMVYNYQKLGREHELLELSRDYGLERNMILMNDGKKETHNAIKAICLDKTLHKNYLVFYDTYVDYSGLEGMTLQHDYQNYELVAVGKEIDEKLTAMKLPHKTIPYPVKCSRKELKIIKEVLSA